MKGEVIFPNPIVLLKFPITKQTHLAILCPSVDNWTRIFALSLPTYLTVQVIYLGLRQKVSTSHPAGWPGDASAQHSLPCPASSLGNPRNFWSAVFCSWLFVGLSFCLIAWQGNSVRTGERQCWMMYSCPMLQQYQIRVWALVTSLYRWCFCGEKWTQYPAGLYSPCLCKSSNRWCFWGEM